MDYPEKVENVMERAWAKDDSGAPSFFVDLPRFLAIKIPYPEDGDRWGRWKFNAKLLELVFEEGGHEQYAVNLTDMDSSAQMPDWIFQVGMKCWALAKTSEI